MPAIQTKALLASAAQTVTGNGPEILNPDFSMGELLMNVYAASGTTPTLNVKIQTKDVISGNWVDTGMAFTQATAAGISRLFISPFSNMLPGIYRFVWTIGGTTPSFTFSISGHLTN